MKTTLWRAVLPIAIIPLLAACQTLAFSGKATAKWKNDIAYQTIKWDVNSSEEDVRREFTAFIRETLQQNRYKDYVLLFQSNYRLEEKERTYVLKIFKSPEAKDAYQHKSQDIITLTRALANDGFSQQWQRLESGMPAEKVYELLPELANFRAKQELFLDHSELRLSDLWLSFDLKGFLMDFGKGNASNSTPKRNEEWVF